MAILIRILGNIDLAEEAVQEAFVVAVERWPRDGLPGDPGAWIIRTARNRAIDRIRRERRYLDKLRELEALAAPGSDEGDPSDHMDSIPDDRLRLFFTCCHPALAREAQVALTLRPRGALHSRGGTRVSRPRGGHPAAHRARQAQDPRRWDPLRGPGRQ